MRETTFSEATREVMAEEMRRDSTVFIMGEDIARQGGIFGQFRGLSQEFGPDCVLDTPISETAIVGGAVGAALTGMRPVADMHFADFMTCAMDELVNQMAKMHYMFGGQARVPVVVRAPDGVIFIRRSALPERGGLVHAHARSQGRHTLMPVRCQGAVEGRYPG